MTNTHDVRDRQIIRDKLQADVDEFLARGGKVEQLAGIGGSAAKSDDDDDTAITAVPFGRNYRDL